MSVISRNNSLSRSPILINLAVIGLTLAGAVIMGMVLVPTFGDLALLGLLGAAGGLLVLLFPALGVYMLAATLLLQNVLIVGTRGTAGATGVKLLGMAVFLAWIGGKMLRRESFGLVFSAKVLKPSFFFLVLAALSIFWAQRPYSLLTIVTLLSMLQLMALSLLVLDTIKSWNTLEWLIRFVVLGALFAAMLTISQYDGTNRAGDDISGNVNHTAAMLTVIVPLGFYMMRASKGNLWRLVGMAYVGIGSMAILLTFSRTSYVVLVLLLVALMLDLYIVSSSRERVRLTFLVIVLAIAVSVSGVVPWDKVFERSSTITPGLQEESQQGRIHLWSAAQQMFLDNPVLGVGFANYGYQFVVAYQFRIEGLHKIYETEKSPHNTVLSILAELGIVGMAIWVWLNGTSFHNLWWSRQKVLLGPAHPKRLLIKAIALCLMAYVFYSTASVTDDHKLFWLLLGMTEVVRHLTQADYKLSNPVKYENGLAGLANVRMRKV